MNIKSEKEVTNAQALKLAGGALIIAGFLLALLNPLLAIVPVFLAYLLLRRAKNMSLSKAHRFYKMTVDLL